MDEKNSNEMEINNAENLPESESNFINNNINNNIDENNSQQNNSLNNSIKQEEEENNIKNSNIISTKEEEKGPLIQNINNDEINESINNINNNINTNNNNLLFQLNPQKKNNISLNIDKNLSKEEKEEQIENSLRNLLSELSNLKQQGNNCFNNKNYEEAEEKYKEGIKKINEFLTIVNIEEVNDQIKEHLMNINLFNIQFYNNLSMALTKQKKYNESLKHSEYIIQNLNQEHVGSYYRILFCLIELNKIITANHYAEIIKKKFGNGEFFSKFQDLFQKLEILNKEFSEKILNKNPELKKEIISINDNLKIKKEEKKDEDNNFKQYLPYVLGGFALLFIGGRYIYKKCKSN